MKQTDNTSQNTEPPNTDKRQPNPHTTPLPEPPPGWQPGLFPHERLDAFWLAKEALWRGDKLAQNLPRGYAKLADQLRRALLAVYLGVAEPFMIIGSRISPTTVTMVYVMRTTCGS